MRNTSLDMVFELALQDERILFLGSDLGAGTLSAFQTKLPERFFMEGISEANLVGMAAGLAMEGHIPYVNTIATFITRRAFEQVALDVCLENLPVRLIGNGGGMVYAPLGPTHEATDDLALMRALPNMTTIAPCDADEMRRLMPQTVEVPGPVYIRLGRGHDPIVSSDRQDCVLGRGIPVLAGSDVLLVTTGITLKLAHTAAEILLAEGIEAGILHLPTIKPLDTEMLLTMAHNMKAVVPIEEHSVIGGLGSAVAEVLLEAGPRPLPAFRRVGLPDVFPDDYGRQDDLFRRYGLETNAIAAMVRKLLGKATHG